ncbi:type VI secretion system tip protein VgrG [Escherichia coli]|nr:type VI secretion system tip protein VgrG [Escherichia coli]MBB7762355.1 type VI secretion system tip protein VgrG [Escherichia coli]
MDNRSAFFDGQTRYFLEINGSAVKPDVLRFRGREALSEPFRWGIGFTSRNTNIPPEEVLMKYASLRMRNGKNVHGIVTRLEWLSTSKDQSHYRLTLSSRLALLEHTRQCAVFQNQSVPEVVEQVLRKHGLEGADFEFRLERAYPSREIITQWQETDLQFIQRILSEVGIYWRTEMDDVRGLDTYIFADSQLHYQFDVRLPYSEPSGLFDGAAESVWDVRAWHNVATGTVTTRDYNYRTATTPMNATVSVRNDAVTTGEHYRYAAPYREAGDDASPEPETESGAFYARLHHERELNRSARIHLFSNAAHLSPGQVLEPQGDVITDLKEGIVLTLVTYRGARDSRLHVSAWGMPYSERYCFRPAEIPRPVIPGTLPARIESRGKNDIYAHLDGQGRYRVKMDFDQEGTEPGYGYLWLRMAKPCAGETLGWHTPLIDGTEVAIAYSNGDIDLPYIAYALHDAEHPGPVNRDNHTRNIFRTPANSKLRMEDRRGEEHIKLATEYGKTQLNSGHLVDSQGQLRGKGTELRTDEWGTLRAGKGLFVAADAQAKAQGEALDIDAALKEIDRLNLQLQQLEIAAERAQALKADIDSQIQMFEQRLKPLNEAVLFSAPEGMALTSGEDMQMSAARNVAVNAGGDISTGTMGNLTALAGERLGLFARTGQLSVKSGEGPVDVQAQNGSMQLFAEKKLTLSSASDISFAGKKRITLIGGGSYLRLEAGKVEYGTMASYMRKVKRTMVAAAMSIEPLMIKGAEVSSDLARQDKLSDSVSKPDDVVGVVESFFSNDPVQLDSVQRKRNAAEEIIKNGTLLLGEDHQKSDSRVVLLDLIAGGKINKLLLEIPDCKLRNRFVEMKGKPPENSAEWATTKDLIDILVGRSETENRVKMSDLIHSALAKGIDVYPMDQAYSVGRHRQAMRQRNIHMGNVYKKVATANEPGVAILVGDDHLKTYPAQAASGVMREQQEVPSLTDCCSLSPGQVLRLDGGEI